MNSYTRETKKIWKSCERKINNLRRNKCQMENSVQWVVEKHKKCIRNKYWDSLDSEQVKILFERKIYSRHALFHSALWY